MTFLQPALLLGLPAILLPILIHLLNRLRYKSVPWAAMMFLVSAARSSTKHARLRHYLILLFRSLIILFLILTISRPIVGGWLANTLAGAPDTVLILLDRSASMETTDPRLQTSKRAHALDRFVQAASAMGSNCRFVLIENAMNAPQEIAGVSALPALSMAGPTDTAADLAAMFATAVDYMQENASGRTEIWVASDMQASNWHPDDGAWADLAQRLINHPMDVRIRLLALTTDARENTSLSLSHLKRQSVSGKPHLNMGVELLRTPASKRLFPVSVTLNGARLPEDRKLALDEVLYGRLLELPTQHEMSGWGRADIPADENPQDNVTYFVYDQEVRLHTAVIANDVDAQRYLRLAAAPAPQWFPHSVEIRHPSQTPELDTEALSLIIWQASTRADDILKKLETFADEGGTVLCFPPATAPGQPASGPFGLQWLDVENAPAPAAFHVAKWDDRDGPLARSRDGVSLPVGQLTFRRRQPLSPETLAAAPSAAEGEGEPWLPLASYEDGQPFLLKKRAGRGSVFVCTSLPHDEWSTLGEGPVLVPMVQRVLREGGTRLSAKGNEECGLWLPADEGEPWAGLNHPGDYRWNAGIYALGNRLVALNRPTIENDPTRLPVNQARMLFGSLDLQVFEETVASAKKDTTSELWPLMLLLAMLCMMAESTLLIFDRMAKRKRAQNND